MADNERLQELYLQSSDMQKEYSLYHTLQFNNHPEITRVMFGCTQLTESDPIYYCQTGMPKSIYHDRLQIPGKTYSDLFERAIRPSLQRILDESGYNGTVYLLMDDSKEISVVFQPTGRQTLSPLLFAERIDNEVQHLYDAHFPGGCGRYCNTTALSDAQHGIYGIRDGYLQTEQIKSAAFFRMQRGVLTGTLVEELQNGVTYREVMGLTRLLCNAVRDGRSAQCMALLERLFLDMLKHSFELELVSDALSFLKHFCAIRMSVYDVLPESDLGTLLSARHYATVEECFESIRPLLLRICEATARAGRWRDAVVDAAYCIRSNLASDLSLADIAAYTDMSPNHISTVFHRDTGYTVKQYQMEMRLRRAANLLVKTDLLIDSISKQVGFLDRRYFTQAFKAAFGVAPARYREDARSALSKI